MKPARRSRLWMLAVLVVIGGLVVALLPARGPSYQGLTLEEWLDEFDKGFYNAAPSIFPREPYPSDPVEAIRNMGQPAVDALLDRMTTTDSEWKVRLVELARKQSVIKVPFKPAAARRGGAFAVLVQLGPSASNAVPRLVGWLSDGDLRFFAENLLANIGLASVEPLQARLASGDSKVRVQAADTLGWIGPDAASAVPRLIDSLSDSKRVVRGAAIRALGGIGEPREEIEQRLVGMLHVPEDALDAACGLALMGSNSVPVLTRALTNEDAAVRRAGAAGVGFRQGYLRWTQADPKHNSAPWRQKSIRTVLVSEARRSTRMRPGAESRTLAMLLINNLQDPDSRVRELSAAMLARFPTEARDSRPALDNCLQDLDAGVREAALRSLDELPKPQFVPRPPPAPNTNPPPPLGPGAVVLPPR